jgi:hypothetical protein
VAYLGHSKGVLLAGGELVGTLKDRRRRPEGGGVNGSQLKFLEGTRHIS